MDALVRRIYRTRDDAMLAGVCSGVGQYFRLDPVLIRLILVALALVSAVFPALIFYAVAWFLIPQEPHTLPAAPPVEQPGSGPA